MRGTFALAVAVTAAAVGTGWQAGAAAAAQPQQTSASPTVVFSEDFEQGSGVTALSAYRSASGIDYTASGFWSNPERCNGFVLSDNDAIEPPGFCDSDPASWVDVRAKSYALGLLGSGDPHGNRAVSSNTAPPGGTSDEIEFETLQQVRLPAADRFVTFSVDAAATACQSEHPSLRFALKDDSGQEVPVSSTAIDPCTDPRSATVDVGGQAVSYGRFPGDGSLLLRTRSVGVVMRNANGDSNGNDGAFDNIRILDVTPQLSAAFAPASSNDDGTTSLTLTVTNTSELAAKSGASFTVDLPPGITAPARSSGGSCTGEQVSATARSVAVSNVSLPSGQHSCSIVVPVSAGLPRTPGATKTYYLRPGDFSALVGMNAPQRQARFTVRRSIVASSSDPSSTDPSSSDPSSSPDSRDVTDRASSEPSEGTGRLAATGFGSRADVATGSLLLIAGGALIAAGRRRRPASPRPGQHPTHR